MTRTTEAAVVLYVLAVATHAGVASIEDGTLGQVFSVGKPVPVLNEELVIVT